METLSKTNDRPVYFGIDLGTSNCSVAYVVPSSRPAVPVQPKVVDFHFGREQRQRSSRFPSVIARKGQEASGRKAAFGFDAEVKARFSPGQDLFRSIKSDLGTLRSYRRAYLPDLNLPVKCWGLLLEQLCERTAAETPERLDPRRYPTVLTVPASFDLQRRQETIDAAERAGFQRQSIRLIDEPVAALVDWVCDSGVELSLKREGWTHVLVFDFGGGTCDLSLVAVRYAADGPLGLEIRNLAISPYTLLGGDTLDLAIMVHLWPQIEKQNGLCRGQLTARQRHLVEEANRLVCRTLKQELCEKLARLPAAERQKQAWGKIKVSHALEGVALGDEQRVNGRVELTAELFHRLMQPFLNREGEVFPVTESVAGYPLVRLVEDTLERAEMTPDDLDVILLHGGSCRNPLVRDAVEAMTGQGLLFSRCRTTQTPDLNTSVARGAALHGYYLHHEQRWLVRPIVSEDLSILTRGDVPEVLVRAGTALPFPATGYHPLRGQLVTSRADQRRMLVPLVAGQPRNGEWPRVAASNTFDLPAGLPLGHAIEVNLRINEDKLTETQFRPAGDHPWTPEWRIDDPWVRQLRPQNRLEELLEVRGQIRRCLQEQQPVPLQLEAAEPLAAARAGHSQEGLLLIEEVLEAHPEDAGAWNIKGLIHHFRAEEQASCDCFEKAARLAPHEAVYRGNYGTALCDLGRYEQAVMEMRGALAMRGSLRYLHGWLATAFARLNQPEEARKELERWLEESRRQVAAEAESSAAWEDLATVCRRLGRYDKADEAQRQARQLVRTRHVGGSPDDLLTSTRW